MRLPDLKLTLLALTAVAVTSACAEQDRASISIDYEMHSSADQWSLQPPARQRIVKAFNTIAASKGYQCHTHAKRIEEVTCKGPKSMNVTFAPALNKAEFVVRFNWVAWHGRTHEEFATHVSNFTGSLRQVLPDVEIRASQER
jgi:hypothetical protein